MITPQEFKYTVAQKPAGTNGRVSWSQDYDTQRENVLYFDGLKAYALAGPDNWNKGIGSAYSLCAWVYIASENVLIQGIINADDSYDIYRREWQFHINTNRTVRFLRFGTSNNVVQNLNTSTSHKIPVGQWTHIAATFDNTIGSKIYINGNMVLSGSVLTTNGDGKSPVTIGARSHDYLQTIGLPSDMLHGNIANAAIFTAGLTQDDIIEIMNNVSVIETNPDLLAYWKLDEGVGTTGADFTGNNDATIYRIKTTLSADWQTDTNYAHMIADWKNSENALLKYGAYDYDSIDDHIRIPNDPSICSLSAITISSYIKTTYNSSTSKYVVESRDTSTDGYILFVYNGSAVIKINSLSTFGTSLVADGKWHHIHATYDGSTTSLYVDGTLEATSSSSLGTINTVTTVRIAYGTTSSSASYFDGQIGETMIYSEALTPASIWNHAAYSIYPDDTNLEGHWKFFNGNLNDETANNNDGIRYGIPLVVNEWDELPQNGFSMLGELADSPSPYETASFDGIDDYVDIGATGGTVKSVSFVVKLSEATSESIMDFDGGTHTITTDGSDQITANGFSSPTYYVDGVNGDRIVTDGNWHHVVIKTATGFSVSNFDIGRIAAAYMGGNICNVALFDYELSDAQALEIFEQGWIDTNDTGLVSYYPLAGDYLDYKSSNDGTNSGTVFVKDLYRPMSTFGDEKTITLSNFGQVDNFRYCMQFDSKNVELTFAVDNVYLLGLKPITFIPTITFF